MSNFFLRTESIKPSDIIDLCVLNSNDHDIIDSLMSSEPVLIEGSRGTGKTFLMRVAEHHIEKNKDKKRIAVFMSFNASSLVYTDDNLQFYHWMLAKTLRALISKLRKKGVIVSQYSSGLLSNDYSEDSNKTESNLKSIIYQYESSYRNKDQALELDSLPDIEEGAHSQKVGKMHFIR